MAGFYSRRYATRTSLGTSLGASLGWESSLLEQIVTSKRVENKNQDRGRYTQSHHNVGQLAIRDHMCEVCARARALVAMK